jgi:hypothetical protein
MCSLSISGSSRSIPSDIGLSFEAGSGARGRTRSSPSTPSRGRYAGRVYVSYTQADFQGDKGVAVTVFDARLRPLAGYPVANKPLLVSPPPQAKPADQFWPASALDPANGTLWVCFSDTNGDPDRKKAWFSCTTSTNGGMRWSPVVRAATAPTDERQPDADSRESGDYEGLAVAKGAAHPIWTDGRDRSLNAENSTTILTAANTRLGPGS